jgi:iron complex transport system permease protein
VGVLFQQVLRNPLAEPTTLGVATGAQLGITITTLWALPGALTSQFAALAGACVVGALVFGVAWGKRLSPVTLILAGLVVSLYCGAINQLLVLFHHDQLQSMFLWSTGTLTQTDWSVVQRLWPQLAGGVVLTLLLLRPLTLMGLDDGVARNLGLALSLARLAALTLAIVFSALLVNAVGLSGLSACLRRCWRKCSGRVVCWRVCCWPADWGADPLAFRSAYSLAGAGLDGSLHRLGDGAYRRAAAAVAAAALRSISAPAMDAGDKVHAERQSVLWFSLPGWRCCLWPRSRRSHSGAMPRLALGNGRFTQRTAAVALAAYLRCADRRGDAGGGGVYYSASDRQPDGEPGSAGISSGAAFGVVLMLFFVPGNAFGWLMPAGSLGAAVTLLIILIAAGRGGFHRTVCCWPGWRSAPRSPCC